jgi:3-hydroxymyristoyl/3-hydroxydecanoyl-(acyl carrier protein) dehydratase
VAKDPDLVLRDVSCDGDPGHAFALRGVLRVAAAHAILRGHFPGAPLVPGVLLLEAVRAACEEVLAVALAITEVRDVRFTRPVAADEPVVLQAQVAVTGRSVEVEGVWHGGGGRVAAFVLQLRSALP